MVLLDSAAGWLDAALVRRGLGSRGAAPDPAPSGRLHQLRALAGHYADDRHLAWPSGGFLTPGAAEAPVVVPRKPGIFDLAWPSGPGPAAPDDPNATAWARVHRAGPAPGPEVPDGRLRPVVLAVHGYGGGRQSAQRLMWPIRAWNRLGLDVVLPALPHHGPRAAPGQRRPPLEPDQPHLAQEAFRQAVRDITALIGWLRAQGYGPIGVVGKSLGGYTAALLATVEVDLAFLALVMPLASVADFARAHGQLGEGPEADDLHAALEAAHRPTSPLSRPPRIAPERVRIVAVRGDRITGLSHAERLGRHFGVAPAVGPGGHLLQVGVDWPGTVAFARRWLVTAAG